MPVWSAAALRDARLGVHMEPIPHCREVEVIHIPKTGGVSLIFALHMANASFCYTETGGPSCLWLPECGISRQCGELTRRSDTVPCGCQACGSSSLESVGVHERGFGRGFGRGSDVVAANPRVLYISIVREPQSWLRSAISQECNDDYGPYSGSLECRGQTSDFLRWYQSPQTFYFATDNLQSRMLGNIWSAPNHVVCTLERRAHAVRLIAAALGHHGLHDVVSNVAAQKRYPLPHTFNFSAHAHLYATDAELYERVARAGGCVWQLTLPRWRAHEHLLSGKPSARAH